MTTENLNKLLDALHRDGMYLSNPNWMRNNENFKELLKLHLDHDRPAEPPSPRVVHWISETPRW